MFIKIYNGVYKMLKVSKKTGKKGVVHSISGAMPQGELQWVNISGEGKENYNQDGYEYTASIVYPTAEGEIIVKQITDWVSTLDPEDEKEAQGNMGVGKIGVLVDKDGDEVEEFIAPAKVKDKMKLSGRMSFGFKTQVSFNGKPNVVAVYNAQNPPKKVKLGDKKVGNGSVGSLQVNIQYGSRKEKHYVSAFLQAVQIFKLEEWGEEADFEGSDDEGGWTGADEDSDTGFTGDPADTGTTETPDLG